MIDAHLKKTGSQYLVGDKCTYADLAFMPWHWLLTQAPNVMGEGFVKEFEEKYPIAWKWNQKLNERPSVKKAREDRNQAMSGGKK